MELIKSICCIAVDRVQLENERNILNVIFRIFAFFVSIISPVDIARLEQSDQNRTSGNQNDRLLNDQ